MKKISTRNILLLIFAFILLLSIGAASSQKLQGLVVSLAKLLQGSGKSKNEDQEELAKLKLENLLLKERLSEYRDLLRGDLASDTDFLTARVVYRCPVSWNSSVWINVGENDNKKIGKTVIAKNSPVVVGSSLVGVVENVQASRSLVRLITDPDLTPSVRAARKEGEETVYLAKGELHGSAKTIWRSRGTLLAGEGFNYDYSDEYGPARDLRSSPAILKVGDLLVTTGMDGIFPPGLSVATVTKIQSLREGDYYYEIEAMPTAEKLEELTIVQVLQPLIPDFDS